LAAKACLDNARRVTFLSVINRVAPVLDAMMEMNRTNIGVNIFVLETLIFYLRAFSGESHHRIPFNLGTVGFPSQGST
jgi:hypothetical protein